MAKFFSTSRNAHDIRILKYVLESLPAGEVIPYAKLSEAIDRDILQHRNILASACNQLLTERHMAFGTVKLVGVKRLDSDEVVESSAQALSRTRNIAKRAARKLASVDYGKLSTDALRIQHNAAMSLFGAIAFASDARNINRIGQMCSNHMPNALPIASTLKLMAS